RLGAQGPGPRMGPLCLRPVSHAGMIGEGGRTNSDPPKPLRNPKTALAAQGFQRLDSESIAEQAGAAKPDRTGNPARTANPRTPVRFRLRPPKTKAVRATWPLFLLSCAARPGWRNW